MLQPPLPLPLPSSPSTPLSDTTGHGSVTLPPPSPPPPPPPQVPTGHAMPNSRFGHSLAVVSSLPTPLRFYSDGRLVERGKEDPVEIQQQDHLCKSFALAFGGINAVYCNADTWMLELSWRNRAAAADTYLNTLRIHSTRMAMRDHEFDDMPEGTAATQAVVRKARKECSIAERELIRETRQRLAIQKRYEDLEAYCTALQGQMKDVQASSSDRAKQLQASLTTEQQRCRDLEALNEEAYHILALQELRIALSWGGSSASSIGNILLHANADMASSLTDASDRASKFQQQNHHHQQQQQPPSSISNATMPKGSAPLTAVRPTTADSSGERKLPGNNAANNSLGKAALHVVINEAPPPPNDNKPAPTKGVSFSPTAFNAVPGLEGKPRQPPPEQQQQLLPPPVVGLPNAFFALASSSSSTSSPPPQHHHHKPPLTLGPLLSPPPPSESGSTTLPPPFAAITITTTPEQRLPSPIHLSISARDDVATEEDQQPPMYRKTPGTPMRKSGEEPITPTATTNNNTSMVEGLWAPGEAPAVADETALPMQISFKLNKVSASEDANHPADFLEKFKKQLMMKPPT